MAKKGQLTTSEPLKGDEFKRFLECLHKDCEFLWELYARLSFCTACRSSDIRKLHWADVLNTVGTQITETKTGKIRSIPFNPKTKEKITELYILLGSPAPEQLIFESDRRKGSPITIQYVNQKLKKFKNKYDLQIEKFSTHSFRKTFGRFVYEGPGDKSDNLVKLNMILKHSSIEVTKRYIGITTDDINAVFSSIDV